MPNWCMNTVRVSGPKKELKKFIETVETPESKFDFNGIVPMPEALKGITKGSCTIDGKQVNNWRVVDGKSIPVSDEELASFVEKYGARDWYDWSCENWGTKWNLDDEVTVNQFSDTEIEYTFDTAWSPPLPVIEQAAEQFPKLTFAINYEEPGNDVAGGATFIKGRLADSFESECEYDEDDEWVPMSKMV